MSATTCRVCGEWVGSDVGHICPGDTPALAALREAEREAFDSLLCTYAPTDADVERVRDAVAARVREEQAEVLTFIQRNLSRFFGHQQHWDPTMRSGQGCPLCIEQNHARAEIEERIRAALPPEGDHA